MAAARPGSSRCAGLGLELETLGPADGPAGPAAAKIAAGPAAVRRFRPHVPRVPPAYPRFLAAGPGTARTSGCRAGAVLLRVREGLDRNACAGRAPLLGRRSGRTVDPRRLAADGQPPDRRRFRSADLVLASRTAAERGLRACHTPRRPMPICAADCQDPGCAIARDFRPLRANGSGPPTAIYRLASPRTGAAGLAVAVWATLNRRPRRQRLQHSSSIAARADGAIPRASKREPDRKMGGGPESRAEVSATEET